MDLLEHLPDADYAKQVIATAARLSRDFIYIDGPNFGAAEYLRGFGLKRNYADWRGHSWRPSGR